MQQVINQKNNYIYNSMEKENENENKKEGTTMIDKLKYYLKKLYEEIKLGISKNCKTIILITVVSLIILYINRPNNKLIKTNLIGGDPNNDGMNNGGQEKKKKGLLSRVSSPLDGATSIMLWVTKNILLLYMFLIFLVAIPTVPAILYITVFYFIMTGVLSKISTI